MIGFEQLKVDVARLDGFFQALSVVDNGWKSVNARLFELNSNDICKSFQKQFNGILNDGDSDAAEYELKLVDSEVMDNWVDWLQNENKDFLMLNILINDSGARFASVSDGRDYMVWQIMEMIGSICDDFESDSVTACNGSISGYKGKYIFIPARGKYLVISLTQKS